jgi:hypothetical protein
MRKITPHKGGRNGRLEVRITAETAAQITAILTERTTQDSKRFTIADWVAEKAEQDARYLAPLVSSI